MPEVFWEGMQKGAVDGVNAELAKALEKSPFPSDDEFEKLQHLRSLLIILREESEQKRNNLAFSKDANGVVITSIAAVMSLAATYVKRSRALRIGGFVMPLFGAYCVMSSKIVYYVFQAITEEIDGRIQQIDWKIKEFKENNR